MFCNIELVRNWSVAFREDLEEILGPKLDGEFGERFEEMVLRSVAPSNSLGVAATTSTTLYAIQ